MNGYWPKCAECQQRRGQTKQGLCNNCYQRAWRAGRVQSTHLDAEFARAHVLRLIDRGMAVREIERAAGFNHGRLHVLLHGRSGRPPLKVIARKTHDALLAIPLPGPDFQPHPRAGLRPDKPAPAKRRRKATPFHQLYVEMSDDLLMTDTAIAERLGIQRESLLRNIDRNRKQINLLRGRRERGRALTERNR